MAEIQCLTEEHIFLIHEAQVATFGGDHGYFRDTRDKVASILAQQYPIFGGIDRYPTIFLKAAMLWFYFTKMHCFVDGNKRVGMQCAVVFLSLNGYDDNLNDREGYNKTIAISTSNHRGERFDRYILSLAEWLEKRFVKRSNEPEYESEESDCETETY